MYRIFFIVFLSVSVCFSARSQEISGVVADSVSGGGVPYAGITVEYPDTVTGCISDEQGRFSFLPLEYPLRMKASALGMTGDSIRLDAHPDRQVRLVLSPSSESLGEVTVYGNARLTSLTENGLSYKMSANERAQDENTLQALGYVPLVQVDYDGKISVQGSSEYSIYLNGRPYEMAQTSPKAFLETLPASSVSKVEVITNPTSKYGPDAGRYVINIVLKTPSVDGYAVNLGGGGNSQPHADGSLLGMVRKGKVDFSMTYNYGLDGQRDQPVEIAYSQPGSDGEGPREWGTKGYGDGDWHTHTLRAMLKWQIDSLNTLYADAHGRINQTNITDHWEQTSPDRETEPRITWLDNTNKTTSGTAEANVIYRRYAADDKDTERFTLGYHFTYNPDKRHLTQHRYGDGLEGNSSLQHTDGGMTEHSGLASYLWDISSRHDIRFSAKNVYRSGDTHSLDTGSTTEQLYSMDYDNNVVEGGIAYSGRVGRTMLEAGVKFNHDHFSMRLPQDAADNFSNNNFYLMPSASVYWMAADRHALYLNYSTSIRRPSVQMLNPFASSSNDYSISQGNPLLKAQYAHETWLSWFYNGPHNLSLMVGLIYSHNDDMIQPYDYLNADNKVVSTYGNLGTGDQGTMMFNLRWDARKWLVVSADGNGGVRHLTAPGIGLDQKDWFYSLTPKVDFLLPEHYRLGASAGIYKNLPDPWSTKNTLKMYSFYASKSFLKGRLNVSVTANSPFSKYHKTIETTRLPSIRTTQTNYITARSFGISLSYSFGSGQKVNLQRDRTMQSADQTTGVN